MTIAYFDCFNGAAGDMLLGSLLDAGLDLSTLEQVLAALPLSGYRIEHTRVNSYGVSGSQVRVVVDAPQPQRDWRTIRTMIRESQLPERTRRWALGTFERLARAEGSVHGVPIDEVHFHEVGAVDSIVDIVGVCAGLELLHVDQVFASPLPSGSGWVMTQHGRIPVPAPATLALLAEAGAPLVPSSARGELVTPTAAALLAELATFTQPSINLSRVGYGLGQKDFGWVNGLRVLLGEAVGSQQNQSAVGSRQSAVNDQKAESRRQEAAGSQSAVGSRQSAVATRYLASPVGKEETRDTRRETREGLIHTPGNDEETIGKHKEEVDSDSSPTSNTTTVDPRLPTADYSTSPSSLILDPSSFESVAELRCNLDDATGEIIAYAIERALAAGALDAWAAPLTMKKGRPGVQLACLTRPDDVDRMAALLLRETPTLGVRWEALQRLAAGRKIVQVDTPWGNVRIKVKLLDGAPSHAAPEYEDCAAIARMHNVPLMAVYTAALDGMKIDS